MKPFAFTVFAACGAVCAVAPAATVDEYAANTERVIAVLESMAEILSAVKDKAGADAAAAPLLAQVEQVHAILAEQGTLGAPTQEQLQELAAKHPDVRQRTQSALASFHAALRHVMNSADGPCYGSPALLQAILSLQPE